MIINIGAKSHETDETLSKYIYEEKQEMFNEGVALPYLIIVNTGRENSVQDSLFNLSVVENLQGIEIPAVTADNQTRNH